MLLVRRDASSNITNKRQEQFPQDQMPHGHDDDDDGLSETMMGSASDYILIAMIVAMMICMAVCCLCLFCRSSHFSLCGWNLEISNRTASVNIDDLPELHEVVPLTPTTAGNYNISDIEKKLKSDPPPPKYNEITSRSVLERFRWRSKRRGVSADDDKAISETSANRQSDLFQERKRHPEKRRLSSWFFQRSISYQPPQVSSWKASTCAKTSSCLEEEGQQTSRRHQNKTLPKSASDCMFQKSFSTAEAKFNEPKEFSENIEISIGNKSISSKVSDLCKEHSSGSCDDEVFMWIASIWTNSVAIGRLVITNSYLVEVCKSAWFCAWKDKCPEFQYCLMLIIHFLILKAK